MCVSAVYRDIVLREAHGDSALAEHPGVGRTSAAVAHSYYWPRLFADVAHFVRDTCAPAKSSNQKCMGAESYSAVPIQPFTSTSKTIVAAPVHSDRTSAEDIALTCKRGSVGQSEGLSIPRSLV